MKKKRLIPVLLLRNGFLVQSKGFAMYRNLGNPITAVQRLSAWACDELIYLDISREEIYDLRRDDLKHPNRHSILEIIRDVSQQSFMPMTVGGRIRTLDDIEQRLLHGADKVAVNTQALASPDFITEAARRFGSQCLVVSIDAKLIHGRYVVMAQGGQRSTERDPWTWAQQVQDAGAGEILINAVDRDGRGTGYDLELVDRVVRSVRIPVIACGGVGEWQHFVEVFERTGADAAAAANIFHYTEQSVYHAKRYLHEHGCPVRPPQLLEPALSAR